MQDPLTPRQLLLTMSTWMNPALHGHFTILAMKMWFLIGRKTTSRCHHRLVLLPPGRQLRHLLPVPSSVLHSSPLPRLRPLPPNLRSRRNLVQRLLKETNLLMSVTIGIGKIVIFPAARLPSLHLQEHDLTISAADSNRHHSNNAHLSLSV